MPQALLEDFDVLRRLDDHDARLIGEGGEAKVYVQRPGTIVRIGRPGASLSHAEARAVLLREIADNASHLPFRTPVVDRVVALGGRVVTLERQLDGEPVSHLLKSAHGRARSHLLANYLESAARIGDIEIERDYFGPLIGDITLRATGWQDYLARRLAHSSDRCPPDLKGAISALASARFAEPSRPALVHLDFFPSNVLAMDSTVTAALDFGASTIMGDARMELWSAVAYLDPEISPDASDADREQAVAFLHARHLADEYVKARRWLAAYWSFAQNDDGLMAWCRRVLLT